MGLNKLLLAMPLIAGCSFGGSDELKAKGHVYKPAFTAETKEAVPGETIQEPLNEEPIAEEPILQGSAVEPPAAERELISQKVVINIPEYRLWLYNTYSDGNTEIDFEAVIGVGRGYLYEPCPRGRYCTPPFSPVGEGWLYRKIPGMRIRYHKGPNAGEVVRWNNGFDEDGNFRREKIDYQNVMRGITTRVNVVQPNGRAKLMHNYALHTTYDEFTVGMPSSGGCARLKKQEMLSLYERIASGTGKGLVRQRVGIEFLYDAVQLDENNVLHLHANIYGRDIGWIEEIRYDMEERGFSCTLDEYALGHMIRGQDAEFHRVQQEIKEIYTRPADQNFVPRELKARLHAHWSLREFCLEEADWLSSL